MGSSPAAGGTQAVDRAAALIDLVVRADDPPSFTELSDETGLARSTTSRLLAALERTDLIERHPNGGYVAGPLFALHAAIRDPWPQVARLARPVLEAIGESTGESVHLGIVRGTSVCTSARSSRRTCCRPVTGTRSTSPPTARHSARCCTPTRCFLSRPDGSSDAPTAR